MICAALKILKNMISVRSTNMKMSSRGTDLLKSVEEYRSHPYDDQTGEEIASWVPGATVGYGHLISESEWPDFCGREIGLLEANHIFAEDLSPFEFCVMGAIEDSFQLDENKFDALVMLAFNIGQAGFKSSSVAKLVNNKHAVTSYFNLEDAWMAWNKSQGKIMRGLVNRRGAEWQMYSDGIYERW